jgi:hypothetical protein
MEGNHKKLHWCSRLGVGRGVSVLTLQKEFQLGSYIYIDISVLGENRSSQGDGMQWRIQKSPDLKED